MAKKPWLMTSDRAVHDRIRRLPKDNFVCREAKRMVREDNDTIGALRWLLQYDYVTQEHVDSHQRWLDAPERLT